MAQSKRRSTKKVSIKRRITKGRTVSLSARRTQAGRTSAKKRTTKKRTTRKSTSKRKITKRSSRGGAQHMRSIENEIKKLHTIFTKRGEDVVEDKADMLEDKIEKLAREGKISEEQAKKLDGELDQLDD